MFFSRRNGGALRRYCLVFCKIRMANSAPACIGKDLKCNVKNVINEAPPFTGLNIRISIINP